MLKISRAMPVKLIFIHLGVTLWLEHFTNLSWTHTSKIWLIHSENLINHFAFSFCCYFISNWVTRVEDPRLWFGTDFTPDVFPYATLVLHNFLTLNTVNHLGKVSHFTSCPLEGADEWLFYQHNVPLTVFVGHN